MKNKIKDNLLQLTLRGTLCLGFIATSAQLMAQEEDAIPAVTEEVAPVKESLDYEMVEISGYIKDAATGSMLSGVRIEALNNSRYTAMTDEDGKFALQVPTFVKTLYISTLGYNSVQYAIRNQSLIEVKLYSSVFKEYYKNEINMMNISETGVDLSSSLSVDDEIGSRLGSEVRTINRSGTPGMGAVMFIRGLNSLNANAQPLVIVDGVMIDKQEGRITMHDGFFNNILAGIDVDEIEKVSVLKNGTALYGARGANGVIIIETKRGKSMATRIDANIYAGVTLEPKLPSMMGAEDYRLYASDMVSGLSSNKKYPWLTSKPGDYYYNMYHNNTDWSDYIYKEAFSQNYKINVQGGDQVAMYNFSLGYTTAETPVEANDFTRLNIRFNTDINLTKGLTTQFNISYARLNRDMRDDGTTTDYTTGPVVSPTYLSLIKSPFLHPYDYDITGKLSSKLSNVDSDLANLANPLSIIHNGDGDNKNAQEYTIFNVYIAPRLQITKDFSARTSFNYALSRMNERYFRPMTSVPEFYLEGKGIIENESGSLYAKEETVYSDTRLEYIKGWGGHSLNLYGGFRFTYNSYLSNYQTGYNTGNDKMPELSTSLSYRTVGGDDDEWINLAYYANAAYNYQNKYFLQGILSTETSSRFGSDTKDGMKLAGVCWGIFPAVQAAWLASSESWFNVPVIDYLKVTAGYDVSGNDDLDYLASRTYFGSKQYIDKAMGLQLQNIGNERLQWETTKRFNVGLEMSLLENRLQLNASVFHSKTSNLLTLNSYDPIVGLDNYWGNSGELKNKGYELGFNAKLINNKNFKWELGATASHYKNEITSLPEGSFTTSICNAEILTQVGQAAGVFYGYKTAGVFSTDDDASAAYTNADGSTRKLYQVATNGAKQEFGAGDMHFVDQNNDGIIDANDKVVIGNPNPDLYGNIYTNFNYKRFTLGMTFNYSLGNDVYNYQRSQLESGSNMYNQTTSLLNRWTCEGDQTNIPRATYGDPMGNSRFSDRWIEDGSYLRLKNVTLSYKVPVPVHWSWLQGMTVWCSGNNLATFTKYLGSDPEFSAGNGVLYQGIDTGLVPLSRNFNIGVKINL